MQNLSEQHIALPTELSLAPKPQGVQANSRRINITPLNNTIWNPSDSILWDFPVNRACTYLNGQETVLMLRVKNNDSAPMYVDHNAASFIQRLDIYSAGQLIETIDNYSVLYSTLLDVQSGPMERLTYNNLLLGSDNDTTNNTFNISRGGVQIAGGATQTFFIPVLSGVIGSGLGRYLPLNLLSELKVVVTLSPAAIPCIYQGSTTPTVWTVVAAEFQITTVQLSPEVDRALLESHGNQPIVLSSETWRNFNTILAAGGSGDQVIIPIKPVSARSLLTVYRPTSILTSYQSASVSARINPFSNIDNGSSFQLLAGSVYYPQKAVVRGSCELLNEVMKCFHGLANVNTKSMITATNYEAIGAPAALNINFNQATYNTYVQTTGTFVAGLNLDIFSGTANKSMCGLNLAVGNNFIIQSYKSGTTLGQQTRMDGFLHYDILLIIDPVTKQISFKM